MHFTELDLLLYSRIDIVSVVYVHILSNIATLVNRKQTKFPQNNFSDVFYSDD